jgi:hypothetical protein
MQIGKVVGIKSCEVVFVVFYLIGFNVPELVELGLGA